MTICILRDVLATLNQKRRRKCKEWKKENVKFSQSMGLLIYIFRQNNKRDYSKNDLRLYMGAYTTT